MMCRNIYKMSLKSHRFGVASRTPRWHGEVLTERERAVAERAATFLDWDAEKVRIRDSLKKAAEQI